jgi:hypothetical protein
MQHIHALPLERQLVSVMQKSLSDQKQFRRYPTAKETLAVLRPIIHASPDMLGKIPRQPKEKIKNEAHWGILQNISCALLNHGHLTRAKEVQEELLKAKPDHHGILNGLSTALALLQPEETHGEETCSIVRTSMLCGSNVAVLVDELLGNELKPDGEIIVTMHILRALWAMCFGNGEHTKAVMSRKEMVQALPKILDKRAKGRKNHDRPLMVLMCVGLCSILSRNKRHRNELITVGVPDHLERVLREHVAHPAITIRVSFLMRNLAVDEECRGRMKVVTTCCCGLATHLQHSLSACKVSNYLLRPLPPDQASFEVLCPINI